MSKRWTQEEDRFIHAYFDAVGDYIGLHDLGRPKGAATKRAKALKDSGAWDALSVRAAAVGAYARATIPNIDDFNEPDTEQAEWMLRNASAIVEMMEAGENIRRASGAANAVAGTASDQASAHHSTPAKSRGEA